MEIAVGILIIALVVWVSRLWAGRSAGSTDEDNPSQLTQSSLLYGSGPNSFGFDQAVLSSDDSSGNQSSAFSDNTPSSGNDTGTQDCTPDSGYDNSGGDCPCPDTSTSYDSGGCSVDSGTSDSSGFDSGSSN